MPWLGFVPDEVTAAPAAAVARLSQRLGIPVGELRSYGAREQTRTDHLRQVVAYCGWRGIDAVEWKALDEFLFARAMEHDSPKLLFRLACEYLVSSRIVRPGVVNLLEHVATARARAREETWTRTEHLLTEQGRTELDGLLDPDPELGRTRLSRLSIGPTSATPAAVKAELEKLAYLRRMDAHTLDVSVLPAERRRFLAQVGRRLTAQALSRREAQPRQTPRYLLASSVPDNWIPLLPVQLQPAPGTVISRLKRGAVLQPDGTHKPHLAQSQVLNVAADVLFYDEDVPREGTHITRTRNVARWIDGSTCAWTAFRKRVGRGEGSSSLRFDQLQE